MLVVIAKHLDISFGSKFEIITYLERFVLGYPCFLLFQKLLIVDDCSLEISNFYCLTELYYLRDDILCHPNVRESLKQILTNKAN